MIMKQRHRRRNPHLPQQSIHHTHRFFSVLSFSTPSVLLSPSFHHKRHSSSSSTNHCLLGPHRPPTTWIQSCNPNTSRISSARVKSSLPFSFLLYFQARSTTIATTTTDRDDHGLVLSRNLNLQKLTDMEPSSVRNYMSIDILSSLQVSKRTSLEVSSTTDDDCRKVRSNNSEASKNRSHEVNELNERIKILSHDPYVYVIPNFLSEQECQDYIQYAMMYKNMTRSNAPAVTINLSKLWPLPFLSIFGSLPTYFQIVNQHGGEDIIGEVNRLSYTNNWIEILQQLLPSIVTTFITMLFFTFGIMVPLIRYVTNQNARTSVAAALNQMDDMNLIRPLLHRVQNITQHPMTNYEAPVLTHYCPGTQFALHHDASMTNGKEWIEVGGQRVMTCICYLNTVERGGETSFDQLKIQVAPTTGMALFFYPAANHTTYAVDPRMTHESRTTYHDKYIIQIFGRQNHVSPPLGLPLQS
jgi:2OG-Fe(II) oxygenase superfamily